MRLGIAVVSLLIGVWIGTQNKSVPVYLYDPIDKPDATFDGKYIPLIQDAWKRQHAVRRNRKYPPGAFEVLLQEKEGYIRVYFVPVREREGEVWQATETAYVYSASGKYINCISFG